MTVTHIYAETLLPTCGHGGEPCSICDGYRRRITTVLNAYDAMRDALEAARRVVDHTISCTSAGCDINCLLAKITGALAATEGKAP